MTGRVDPTVDNALKIISGGTKAALDPRIVGLPAAEVSKISEKRKLHSAINNPERLIK